MPRGHANRPGEKLPAATVAGACKCRLPRRFAFSLCLYLRIHARAYVNIRVAFTAIATARLSGGDPYGTSASSR